MLFEGHDCDVFFFKDESSKVVLREEQNKNFNTDIIIAHITQEVSTVLTNTIYLAKKIEDSVDED